MNQINNICFVKREDVYKRQQEMTALVSLKAGIHELKLVARDKDFNIDYYIFEKAGDYVGPIIPDEVTNEGTGAMLQEGAVEVSMSSSENSQDMACLLYTSRCV